MKTRHHRLPKCFKFNRRKFFNERSRDNILIVSEDEHRAWNLLTDNSRMTCAEIAQSLSRFVPDDVEFIVVKRSSIWTI